MLHYLLRRLILLPVTLFFIILVNFIIINLAPGDPTTVTEISPEGGASRKEDKSAAFGHDDRYLQFREFYGLTLPILYNTWPLINEETVRTTLWQLLNRKNSSEDTTEMDVRDYDKMRITFGDKARFIMPLLLKVLEDPATDPKIKVSASRFFARGGTRMAILGSGLTDAQKNYNRKISEDNQQLRSWIIESSDNPEVVQSKIQSMRQWYERNAKTYHFEPDFWEKVKIFFFDTRFYRYMSRVLTLDFGTMRNDANKTVVSEVVKRFKYSLTLSILPMFITFGLCLLFGFIMALTRNLWPDRGLNLVFLALYAIPVFVVAPFLIEYVALNRNFPFTNTPIPISGFTSPDHIYEKQVSYQRLLDVLQHIALPIVAVMYGSLAAQTRLARTAVLEVLHQDYVRTARAKGVAPYSIMTKHVGRNAAITIVTSLAGSLGAVLAGSLIVETLFEINGFGKFFYDAILNRDYNVIMFSTLAGSFLALLGYLVADVTYTILDPRVTLD
jgi:peptide/nickel transport system permease protein